MSGVIFLYEFKKCPKTLSFVRHGKVEALFQIIESEIMLIVTLR